MSTTNGGPYTSAIPGATTTTYTPNFAIVGTYYVVCETTYCGGSLTSTSGQVQINVVNPPSNDLCSSATSLTINAAPISGNITSSSATAGLGYGPTKKDVWYSFTPSCTGTHTITVTGYTGDIDVDVFTNSCPASGTGTFTSHGSGTSEIISQTFTNGVTYYVRVLAWDTTAETTAFTIGVVSSNGLSITNSGSPATGNVLTNTTSVLFGFDVTPTSCTTSYDLTNVTITKTGTSTTADLSNIRIYFDADGNGVVNGGESSVSGAGISLANTMNFTLVGQTGLSVIRKYLLVADVSASATSGRTFTASLASADLTATTTPSGAVSGTAVGNTQTIIAPDVAFSVVSATVSEDGVVYNLQAVSSIIGSHTVNIYVSGGTAINGTQYNFVPVTATFASSTTFTTSVTINDNSTCDGSTNVIFGLNSNVNCQIGTNNTLQLSIYDNEQVNSTLKSLSFETTDDWSYTTTGTGATNTTTNKYFGTKSYRMDGAGSLTTSNMSLAGYSDVTLTVAFASFGVDSGDDLFLDISYDNGVTWTGTGSIKLVDGFSNAGINMGSTNALDPTTVATNPWIVNVPSSATQISVRLRSVGIIAGEYYFIDNIILKGNQCVIPCVPTHTVTSFTPTSGPVGTEVTINGTGLTGTTVSFSGINATIVSNTGTQIVALIPTGATTGIMSVKDSQPCTIDNAYTIITKENSSCEGSAAITDLIIYDIHDEKTGSGGFITLFNGTAAPVNLANYTLWRTSTHDDGNEIDYANLTGTIASGALGILKVSAGSCGPASTNGTIDGGFNENDGIQLRNAAGTVVIDDVDTYPTAPGYYMVRNNGALLARTSYVAADWSTIPLAAGECYPSAGLTLPSTGAPPVVTTHPTYVPSCGITSAVLTTAGTEGFAGGLGLAYQWYYAAPGSVTWTAVTDGGIYSGATAATLNISNITGVINYQYYCQIRENTATCYSATNAIKITDTNASTWDGTTWIGGTPTISKAAIIDGTYVTGTNGDFSCCSLTVNATKSLTISSNGYVEVQNNVTNNGTLNILNNGSLVQIDDAGTNTGNINMERIANIRLQDYVYWSAPTSSAAGAANFPITSVSPATPTSVIWKWDPVGANYNGGLGMWINTTENMIKGKGYIVRGPSGISNSTTTPLNVNFIGVPNNGVIPFTIQRGNDLNAGTPGPNGVMRTVKDDNHNLIGNPYPSAIDADLFIDTYGNPAKPAFYADIEGSVRIWSHNTLPSSSIVDPFYADYQSNYTANDYIIYNSLGSQTGPATFNGKIAAGQGFFVIMNDGAAGTNTINFKNSLRSRTFNNSQFFRTNSNVAQSGNGIEKHRIWLDLVSSNNSVVRTLIGYANGATNQKDNVFDAIADSKNSYNLYSVLDNEVLTIQGRTLPFDVNDKVQLGVAAPASGTYKIAIATADGIFSNVTGNQKVYLEDTELNVIHDLTSSPYQFTIAQGKNNTRFVLRYTESTLSNELISFDENDINVYSDDQIHINSKNETIQKVDVYDTLGRLIFQNKDVNNNNLNVAIMENNIPLIVKISLENGAIVYKKIIH
ncbi:lamin tail domain-containing protein [Flavobacterium urocaniciphilum]|uniref:Lamin Tail Domain n=1 Tax=Flavobacterium urocaniciphilum TaxID=1299341 RepID=A0A1H9BIQ9_9FLAO|nr:lamin tail domain-containing protein [Flavobacterium urocaniciphilum]SEP88856.1 Lamin Tail Domain [Flavobacterium urocaniciphilum]